MANKQYINKCSLKEHVFDNGDALINCAFSIEELAGKASNGWVNITIARRREAKDGKTHYAYFDSYKPKNEEQAYNDSVTDGDIGGGTDDNMPF